MLDFVVVWLAANIARALAIDNLQIPQVNHDVNSMVNEYQQYASYAGPTGTVFVSLRLVYIDPLPFS